jgi:membrane protein DedA with SNARE-associated domain
MSSLSDLVMAYVISYGTPAFGAALLIGAIGIPAPTSLLVVAGGAFVRQGYWEPWEAFALGLTGAVLGDIASFMLGRFAGQWVEKRFGGSSIYNGARQTFQRYGGGSIYFSRWILTSIAIPVNLLAGGSGYPLQRFLLYDILGEATWLVLLGALGYWVGSQWEAATQFITDSGGLVAGMMLLAGGIYLAIRLLKRK